MSIWSRVRRAWRILRDIAHVKELAVELGYLRGELDDRDRQIDGLRKKVQDEFWNRIAIAQSPTSASPAQENSWRQRALAAEARLADVHTLYGMWTSAYSTRPIDPLTPWMRRLGDVIGVSEVEEPCSVEEGH